MSRVRSNGWGVCAQPHPQATSRLFCFPYAGGSASAFHAWAEQLPATIELWAIQLAGRENRWQEPAYTNMDALLPDLAHALQPALDRPYAFFGHSLGALLAYELARLLRRQGDGLPTHLFVSGHRAPHLPRTHKPIHDLPLPAFKEEILRLNGTPAEILENDELMALLLDMLRADFTLAETYTYTAAAPLPCPIVAFGGLEDELAPPAKIQAWARETVDEFSYHLLPGDHFFLHRSCSRIIQILVEAVAACTKETERSLE